MKHQRYLLPAMLAAALHVVLLVDPFSQSKRMPSRVTPRERPDENRSVVETRILGAVSPAPVSLATPPPARPAGGGRSDYSSEPVLPPTAADGERGDAGMPRVKIEMERVPLDLPVAQKIPVIPMEVPWPDDVSPVPFNALDHEPVAIDRAPPVFPPRLRRARQEGVVTVAFVVSREGQVIEANAVQSDSPEFTTAALAAVRQWRYEPGMKGGMPVRFEMTAYVLFFLDSTR